MIGWITDPHFDHIKDFKGWIEGIDSQFPEVSSWVLTGDLASLHTYSQYLIDFQSSLERDVYFVLGNHDYYGGSWSSGDKIARSINRTNVKIHWLREASPIKLSDTTCLVGNSGWYDARYGNKNTPIMLNDFRFVIDLTPGWSDRKELIKICNKRAKKLSKELDKQLKEAVSDYNNILIATHVPPFQQATWHNFELSEPNWLPWFSSKATGDILEKYSKDHLDKKFLVLCGHSHGSGQYKYSNNMTVYTGASKYGAPGVSGLIHPSTLDIENNGFRFIYGVY